MKRSSSRRTIARGRTRSGASGIGSAEGLAHRQRGTLHPGRDRQRHAAREPRVDLQQRRVTADGLLDLDVADAGQTDALYHGVPSSLQKQTIAR